MFKQVKQNRAFEDVFSQIQALILRGDLRTGDKLPSERQLRETFNVSRGTLREAFRALEQRGLIAIKTGVQGGAIVRPVDTRLMSESLDLLLQHQKISLGELAEFREEVEGLVAAKAAKKARREDVEQLNVILHSIKGCLDADPFDWKETVTEDGKFHFLLARIAGNRVFESVLSTVYDNIYRYFDRFLSKERGLMVKNYRDLCKIAEAIRERDSRRAQELVQDHVKRFNRIMEKGRGIYESKD
jgi:DNA-binding FadR family transcriptional regulator